jgi:hypothetical protein
MIGYSYYIPIGLIGIGVAAIYLLLALSDLIAERNKYLTYFLIFVSVTISIPRATLQVADIVELGREAERLSLKNEVQKPIKRTIEITLLDCGRIPNWEGQKQIDCSKDNQKQIQEKNRYEIEYEEKLETYYNILRDRELEIQDSFLKYINLKNLSHIILILLVTPILPLVVILLIHKDFSMFSEVEEEHIEKPKKKTVKKKRLSESNRKEKAKTLLKAGIKVSDVQDEMGFSKATLYRYKREIET